MKKNKQMFRHVFFPYALKLLDNGNFAVVNRKYQRMHCAFDAEIEGLTSEAIAKVSWDGSTSPDERGFVYLYNDSNTPMQSTLDASEDVAFWLDEQNNQVAYFQKLMTLSQWMVGMSATHFGDDGFEANSA